jgi:anti-anti-sigma factor
MDIQESKVGAATVAKIAGRLDTATAPAAQARLLAMLTAGATLVADMTDVGYVSSAGLRVLLTAAKQAKSVGARFGLAAPQDSVREVLAMSGFDRIIQIHATVDAAAGGAG